MLAKKSGYGLVLQSVMRDSEIDIEGKAIYAYLAAIAGADGKCFPSIQTMCHELKVSKDRLYRHLDQLVERGIVTRSKQRNGNRYERNLYTLTQFPYFKETQNTETDSFQDTHIQFPGIKDTHNEDTRDKDSTKNKWTINREQSTRETNNTVYERVCFSLNRAKKACGSKGRLKPSAAGYMLRELFEAGFSAEKIEAEAVEYSGYCIANNLDADWSSFARFCLERKRNSRP